MLSRDAVSLRPRSRGMNGYAAQGGQLLGANGRNNLGVRPHSSSMHYAQVKCKRLLHSAAIYALRMSTPNERLKAARKKHFSSAGEAADAMGVPRGTYAGHENGHRGFPASRAPAYARRFKVTEEWLLYGKGDGPAIDAEPSEDDLAEMVRVVIEDVVTVQTKISDLPRIVAPGLREQLERYRADRARPAQKAASSAPDKGAPPPSPTR